MKVTQLEWLGFKVFDVNQNDLAGPGRKHGFPPLIGDLIRVRFEDGGEEYTDIVGRVKGDPGFRQARYVQDVEYDNGTDWGPDVIGVWIIEAVDSVADLEGYLPGLRTNIITECNEIKRLKNGGQSV